LGLRCRWERYETQDAWRDVAQKNLWHVSLLKSIWPQRPSLGSV
jgi:hypothetical protein